MAKRIIVRGSKLIFEIDGQEVTEKEFHKAVPNKALGVPLQANTPGCWPMESEALAVHPKQVQEANERNRKHGVNVTYKPDGTAVIPDRGERKKILKLEGFYDRSGGYGD